MHFNDIAPSQDDIYSLLLRYLVAKGVLSQSQANRGWHHDTEKIYKDFVFTLGVTPPISMPTNEETLPVQLIEDPVWLELVGMEVVSDGGSDLEIDVAASKHTRESEDHLKEEGQVEEDANGDIRFVLKTGLTQPKVPTEGENLASTVVANTEQVAKELEGGEVVTKESLEAEKKVDEDAESDAPPEPTTAPAPSTPPDEDLDHIDA